MRAPPKKPSRARRRELVATILRRLPKTTPAEMVGLLRAAGAIVSVGTAREDMQALGALPKSRKRLPSVAEETFALALEREGPPGWVREHQVVTGRRWRFDFAWPDHLVAVEIHGGHWSGGRHVRGKGFESDLEKANVAVLNGWRVLAYTADRAQRRPLELIADVRELIERRAQA